MRSKNVVMRRKEGDIQPKRYFAIQVKCPLFSIILNQICMVFSAFAWELAVIVARSSRWTLVDRALWFEFVPSFNLTALFALHDQISFGRTAVVGASCWWTFNRGPLPASATHNETDWTCTYWSTNVRLDVKKHWKISVLTLVVISRVAPTYSNPHALNYCPNVTKLTQFLAIEWKVRSMKIRKMPPTKAEINLERYLVLQVKCP